MKLNCIKKLTKLMSLSTLVVFLQLAMGGEIRAADGKALFNGNCAACHKVDADNVGPALKGVTGRWKSKELLFQWIKNPQSVLDSGDPYAKKLFNQWKSSGLMAAQPVNDEEITAILDYIENYVPPVKTTAAAGGASPTQMREEGSNTIFYVMLLVVFVIVIFAISGVRRQLESAALVKDGKEALADQSFLLTAKEWAARNRKVVSIIMLFIVIGGAVDGYKTLMKVGVYGGEGIENYHPSQPIAFSHKIHAGENEIACQYCHSSVEKGRHAGIPSANVCMNCHISVSEGPSGTEEIEKIYKSVGWDKEKRKYTGETEPVKWNKVHNLPDHVYFNHSQHVVIGEIECQKCHGEVEKMTTVEQFAPLTMGWCINCHKETDVQIEGKAKTYYDEMMVRLKKDKRVYDKHLADERITVQEIGGWECAKCHY